MNPTSMQLAVNYPNIPVLSNGKEANIPFGEFIPSVIDPKYHVDESVAQLHLTDMYLPHFSLRSFQGSFVRDANLYNHDAVGTDLMGSCLFLKGNILSLLPNQSGPLEGYQGTQNFKFDPDNEFRHVIEGEVPFHILHISYTTDYLNEILPHDEAWADLLKTRIRNKERIHGEKAVQISAAQERALQTIFDNPLTGKLGHLMLETAVVQVILLQMNSMLKQSTSANEKTLSKRDIETVYGLKDHLATTFLEDHSVQGLAQHFGMNTNKLMASFKRFFGKSIFEHLQELRMEYAHQLLLNQDVRVTEVARTVGYKNANHFSAAFKRQFGICPKQVR